MIAGFNRTAMSLNNLLHDAESQTAAAASS
jgi:hypothetical protein